MANDAPAGSLSQKVERYFSLLILFINSQSMISNDVNPGLSQPFWGMGPGPLELGKIASFRLKLGKNTMFYEVFIVRLI